jgi:putative peptide zinc metalloprotease protein
MSLAADRAWAGEDARPGPLLSEQWYRVAGLRPRLNPQVTVRRVSYRGRPWIVLVLPDGRDRLRVDPLAWSYFGRCDGQHTAEALWNALLPVLGDDMPSQDELLAMAFQLWRAQALEFDRPADFGLLSGRSARPEPREPKRSLLALRIPLGCPDAFLARLDPLGRALFGRAGALAAAAVAVLGLLLALSHAREVGELVGRLPHSPHLLVLTWLAFVSLKLAHEVGHGLALRRFGSRVPEWGVTLMAFTPVPYVDAGPADALPSRRQRLTVSAAGLMVEGTLAVAALLLALGMPHGPWRDLGLLVFLVGALSSWAVNANPLLRFDGYFAFCDALELPNLATRSAQRWGAVARRAFGLPARPPVADSRLEAVMLWVYTPASWSFRVLVCLTLVAWFGSASAWLGAALALLLGWALLLAPLGRGLRALLTEGGRPTPAQRRRRAVSAAACAALLLSVLAVPLPQARTALGVVWTEDDRTLRAGAAGIVVEAPEALAGRSVQRGERLFVLDNPTLRLRRAQVEQQVARLQTEYAVALEQDLARAQRLRPEIATRLAELARLDEQIGHLVLHAAQDGELVLQAPVHWSGRHVGQGTTLGHVVPHEPPAQPLVRMAVPASWSADLAGPVHGVQVRFASQAGGAWTARIERDHRAAQRELPSAALGDRHGGRLATDPGDPDGLRTAEDLVLVDLRVLERADGGGPVPRLRLGERVEARFELPPAPLARSLADSARRWVHRHLGGGDLA